MFGVEGHGYTRVRAGCRRSTVDDPIRRLTTAVASFGTERPATWWRFRR
jgi:bifunctional pyridoxal-dependent enzyme with beta-cystathionase and maltose regulon repressor activities